MSRTTIVDGSSAYVVNFDDPRAAGQIYQAIVIAQAIDEITGEPLNVPIRVTTTLAGVRTKSGADGVAGLVGTPSKVFPDLATLAYAFAITFEAVGYMPWTANINLAIQPSFPDDFMPVDLGQARMHRTPISLTGTTVELDAQNHPVAVNGATVSITGIWRRTANVDLSAPPGDPNVVSITPSLYAERPNPGSDVEIVTLTPVVEPDRWLTLSASAGDRDLFVSQSIGLSGGAVVGIDRDDPDRAEHIEIQQVIGPSDPNSPAILRLRFPLKYRHRENARVRLVTVPPVGPPDATTTDDAMVGDVTLFVNSTAAFGPAQTVRIHGGAFVPEYAECRLYSAVSDADGRYRLPWLSRLAAVEVTAHRSVPPPALNATEPISFNYNLFENRHDLTLS